MNDEFSRQRHSAERSRSRSQGPLAYEMITKCMLWCGKATKFGRRLAKMYVDLIPGRGVGLKSTPSITSVNVRSTMQAELKIRFMGPSARKMARRPSLWSHKATKLGVASL
jgi:hypothetical protein